MLGDAFHRVFGDAHELKCSDIDVNATGLSPLDFRDFDAYRADVLGFRPDFLFHLGAHTSLEYCEENPDDAYATNTLAVEHAVHIANALNIPLLYISTAGIFDGAQETYDDWDRPNPLGHYARSKYMGERFVAENVREHLVCRAGWMMGGGPAKDKKFVQKLMKQLKDGKRELFVVDDKLGTPTYTIDFARNVDLLLGTGFVGHLQHGLPGRDEPARSRATSGARAWAGDASEGHAGLVGLFRGRIFRRAARLGAADHEEARPARPQHHARLARLPRGISRRCISGLSWRNVGQFLRVRLRLPC